jgi:hypothetical protein
VEDEDIEVDDVTYFITSFSVLVKGKMPETIFESVEAHKVYIDNTLSDILDFIHTVATHNDFRTATFELVDISIPEPLTEEGLAELVEEGEVTESEIPSATINLVIYGYKGG